MSTRKLSELLNAKVRDKSRDDILAAMGYVPVRQANRDRLNKILTQELMGLEGRDYDLKYDSRRFLKALCGAVGLDYDNHESEVEGICDWITMESKAFQPYLFADTGFKRSHRPGTAVFILAVLEPKRNLRLSRAARLAPRDEVIAEGVAKVRSHYEETGGELFVWGTIHRYLLFLAPRESLIIDIDGSVLGEGPPSVPSRAGLSI